MAWGGLTFSLLLIFLAMAMILLFRARSLEQQSGLPGGGCRYRHGHDGHRSRRADPGWSWLYSRTSRRIVDAQWTRICDLHWFDDGVVERGKS